MKVGIIGSGVVGQTLGKAFLTEGHSVMLGTRNTRKEEVVSWKNENIAAQTGTMEEAATFGELLVLATEGGVAEEAIMLAGTDNFKDKTLIDVTNPIAKEPPENGVLRFFTNLNESLMERIQKLVPEARVVKAFSSVGSMLMYKPIMKGGTPTMFICGNDDVAKQLVKQILDSFGWEAEDMGTVEAARAIEPLAMLWCIPGFLRNDWMHAFKLLKA